VVAYRLINGRGFLERSVCPSCQHQLAWYHLIPLFSWIFLCGRCHFCKKSISWLYPAVEVMTALTFTGLWYLLSPWYFVSYALFFSGLIVALHTDIRYLLIPTLATLGLISVGIVASAAGLLPISTVESIAGILCGVALLWGTRSVFWWLKGQEGLGWGDVELLAMIGSFIGPVGVLITLLLGSLSGSLVGLALLGCGRGAQAPEMKIPFGAFLAGGAMTYVLLQRPLLALLGLC